MIFIAYAVRDEALNAFLPPMFVRHESQIVRYCADAVNERDGEWAKHPGDYSLFEVGSYDDVTGLLSGLSELDLDGAAIVLPPRRVILLSSLVRKE
jgi:hypothetical protein